MLTVHPLTSRRGKAYARDCLSYLGIAAATVSFGLVAQRFGLGSNRSFVFGASAMPPVLAAVLAARQESGPTRATPGIRRYQLIVTDRTGRALTLKQALLRNFVKITVPWQLGHTVAVGAAFGGFNNGDPLTIGAAIVTYPLLGAMVAGVAYDSGHALHDHLTASKVISTTGTEEP